jgi:hypothetical protein
MKSEKWGPLSINAFLKVFSLFVFHFSLTKRTPQYKMLLASIFYFSFKNINI